MVSTSLLSLSPGHVRLSHIGVCLQEKHLCQEIKILPSHYLNMLQIMSVQILDGNITNKSEAHSLFKVEPSKIDKVYDMLVEKGIAQPS